MVYQSENVATDRGHTMATQARAFRREIPHDKKYARNGLMDSVRARERRSRCKVMPGRRPYHVWKRHSRIG